MSAADLNQAYVDAVTRELRANGWQPDDRYLCGCCPAYLCVPHREQRAIDHYHPELIK